MIRLSVRAPAADSERLLGALLDLAPSGVEQVDGDGWVEFALYGAAGELPSLGVGEAELAGVRVLVRGDELPDDWDERWKRFHHAVLVGGRLHVRPPWEPRPDPSGVEDIVIDPGQAFGTGAHATTRLCLELLLEVAGNAAGRDTEEGRSFADLGCGSGVLAIAAARLGFSPVAAVDFERAAVETTQENARINGVALERVERVDLRTAAAPTAEVVAANLMRPLLLDLAPRLEPPDLLILSGLLDHEADEIAAAFAPLTERRRLSSQGWSALLLDKWRTFREPARST